MSINQFKFLQETTESLPDKTRPRIDMVTRVTVEQGISLQQSVGTVCAIEYLQANGVPQRVTQRVLSEPGHRRS